MSSWARTADGWALNLDGADAAREFTLPRLELHSGPQGWTCVCHLADGTQRALRLGSSGSASEAKRLAAAEALRTLGERYEPALRGLLA